MTPPKLTNGSWLVIAVVTLGLILALIALKFRRFPHERGPQNSTTQPAPTTAPASRGA